MDRSSLVLSDNFLRECRTGWLLIEDGFGGRLNEKEKLKYALQCTGRNPSQRSIDKYWTQNGGGVTFTQFCGIMRREHPHSLNDLVTLFKKIDKNKDGLISANDLIKLLTKRGEPMTDGEVQGIIDGLDLNEDKQLDYMEFCQYVIETTEDCLRAARLKVQEKEEELEDNKRDRSRRRHERMETSTGDSMKERKKEAKRQISSEGEDGKIKNKNGKKNSKKKATSPAVIYPIGQSRITEGSEQHSSPEDDMSSDLPTVTPTSVDAMSPLSSIPSTDVPEVLSPVKGSGLPLEKKPIKVNKHPQQHADGTGENEQLKESEDIENKGSEDIENKGSEDIENKGSDKDKSIAQLDETCEKTDKDVEGSDNNDKDPVEEKGSEDIDNNNENSSVADEIDEELEEDDKNGDGETAETKLAIENTKEEPCVRQPNHLPSSDSLPSDKGYNTLSPLVSAAPKPPKDLETWNSIEGKGCFYVESGKDDDPILIQSHQYALCLDSPSHVWIEMTVTPPGNPLTDMGLYIFHMNKQEEPTQLITYTQHFINGSKWVCRLDLDGGNYSLLPYTSGCWLQSQEEEDQSGDVPLIDKENGKIILTPSCINVLKEIFIRHDLDSNGAISRSEFDFFHEKTSQEVCDDSSWKIVEDNFDHNNDNELTLKGFLDLHEMTANDEDGGEQELWSIMEAMGYNRQLKLTKACPFAFEVFTQECDGEIEILPMGSSSRHVDHALCRFSQGTRNKWYSERWRGGCDHPHTRNITHDYNCY